ncbi:MAG: chromosomal replication initiator protein DnaA [Clostridia bacterium]|nr:chromosomal replication initiator protein DnaA [Clostridia bacterium]
MTNTEELRALWGAVKEAMREKYVQSVIDLWFDAYTLVEFDGTCAVLETDNAFKHNIVKNQHLENIRHYFEVAAGFPVEVRLRCTGVTEEEPVREEEREEEPEEPAEPLIGGTIPPFNFSYTFDNYVVGSSNKFAYTACWAVANNPAYRYNPLFIYGPSGLGKTHLMYAITNAIRQKNPNAEVIYIKSEDFTNQMIESLSRKSMPEFRNKYRHCDVLLIDDIQFIARKEGIQEEFFHTFNTLVENNRQVILASDRPPAEIHPLEERLKSRFEQGLLADIQPPDFELRAAIIKNKAASVSLELPDDVLEFLAENLRSNIRQIEGAIKKLGAMSFVSGKPVTVDLARTAITDIIGGAEPVSVTVDKIFTAVCRKYSVTRSELESNSRKKELTQPRHLCIYLIREVTGLSLPQIAKLFSRDHSTILSSYKTIEKRCAENAAFKTEVREMIKEFHN